MKYHFVKVIAVLKAIAILQVAVVAIVMVGCVSQSKYDEALGSSQFLAAQVQRQMSEIATLTGQNQELTLQVAELTDDRSMLTSEKAAVEAELTAREDALVAKLDELRATFSQELDDKSVRIERLKNDIKVDLADDILYDSGRAELNYKGQEVIKKVASQLADAPYLIRIIGNTDNVPITGRLAQRFPTNWDLAAARAVGVVSLLQDEGVSPEKIEAVSRGEYYPVADNDSAESRAKNRRTEILMRVQ